MSCLLPNCAYRSETSRMLELHRALTARGAPVCVATHGGTYRHLLDRAGVAYEVIGPPMDGARSAAFVRSGVGLGDPRQSMYGDAEMRAYVRAEADHFRALGVRVAVTGFTLTTLLSTRLAGVRLVTEHAGSFVPPVFTRGLLPLPDRLPSRALRLMPRPLARRAWNAAPARQRLYCDGFNRVAGEFGLSPGAQPRRTAPRRPDPGAGGARGARCLRRRRRGLAARPAGGQGSVQTAMAGGTPLVGLPLQAEQELNVALVERLGAARRVSPRTPQAAGAAVAAVLADRSHRAAAGRVRDLYAAVDGPARAADEILALAA